MESSLAQDEDWDAIAAKLPSTWRELAPLHGVLKSKSPAPSAAASGLEDPGTRAFCCG